MNYVSMWKAYVYNVIKKLRNNEPLLYRDEHGMLIAKRAHSWEEIKNKIENNIFILGR